MASKWVKRAFLRVSMGTPPVPPPPPPPPPMPAFFEQLGEVTLEELKLCDGTDLSKPLLMAINGQIYDVTTSRMVFGPGGPYGVFAGKDASRAIAKSSYEEKDMTGDISGLGPLELKALQDWEEKFTIKYVKVGTIKKTTSVTDASVPADSNEATNENAATSTEIVVHSPKHTAADGDAKE